MAQTKAQLLAGKSDQSVTFNDVTATSLNGGPFGGARNRIINGDMRIDQRNAGASVTAQGYTLDRWFLGVSQSSKLTLQQNAGSVTPPAGFSHYLGITSSSAYSITSTDGFVVVQAIEGFNTSSFAWGTASAVSVTLSFWVRSSLTGTFGGAIKNSANTRSYPFSYTISASNTWEYKSITIPGDTSGTWLTDNGIGLQLKFGLGVGSTYSGTAGTWASSNFDSATGATSVVGTNGATFYITGVQLEAGSVATPFERRSYGQELALCQRYGLRVEQQQNSGGVSSTASLLNVRYQFPVTMRSTPTASFVTSGSWIVGNDYSANYTASSATIGTTNLTPNGGRIAITGFPTFAGNYFLAGTDAVGTAVLFLSAEL